MLKFKKTPEFEKDLKRLQKKHHSLVITHFNHLKKLLSLYPEGNSTKKFHLITKELSFEFFKFRLFKENMPLRFIYSYCEKEKEICFIEVYSKSEKENNDKKRLKNHLRLISTS